MEDDDRMDAGMGGSFWLKVFGVIMLGGIAAMLVFLVFEAFWYRWSLLGAIVLFTGVLLLIAWIGDRRSQKRYEDMTPRRIEQVGRGSTPNSSSPAATS